MNIINFNKLIKRIFILLILLCIYVFVCAFSYVSAVSNNISNSVFRLHVIANSNEEFDQNLKYLVRDNVLEYVNKISNGSSSKEEVIKITNEHIDDIQKVAEQTIYDNGYNYNVNIKIGNFEFPTKNYGDISLPAGYYDALRIEIGNACGKNWWCVMFPPLCFVDVSSGIVPDDSKEKIKENLDEEEFDLISTSSSEAKFKFKILELFNDFNIITAKK